MVAVGAPLGGAGDVREVSEGRKEGEKRGWSTLLAEGREGGEGGSEGATGGWGDKRMGLWGMWRTRTTRTRRY